MVALAILAALAGLAGCDQDKVLYSGRNYLMFSDTLYHYAVQESNGNFELLVALLYPLPDAPTTTARLPWKWWTRKAMPWKENITRFFPIP